MKESIHPGWTCLVSAVIVGRCIKTVSQVSSSWTNWVGLLDREEQGYITAEATVKLQFGLGLLKVQPRKFPSAFSLWVEIVCQMCKIFDVIALDFWFNFHNFLRWKDINYKLLRGISLSVSANPQNKLIQYAVVFDSMNVHIL